MGTDLIVSEMFPGGESTYPCCFVLTHNPDSYEPFVTHMRVHPPAPRPEYRVWGHYFTDLAEATTDYANRVQHERKYQKGATA